MEFFGREIWLSWKHYLQIVKTKIISFFIIVVSNLSKTDNAGVIANPKGEMKGSQITGPVAKECADIWPKVASNAGSVVWYCPYKFI